MTTSGNTQADSVDPYGTWGLDKALEAAGGGQSAPSGSAGGDLGGDYPDPQVVSTSLAGPLPVGQGGTGAGTVDGALAVLGAATADGLAAETSRAVTAETANATAVSVNAAAITAEASRAATAEAAAVTTAEAFTTAAVAAEASRAGTAEALALPLAGGTMTGPVDMAAQQITGLPGPAATADAATKGYVDATAQGLSVKASVLAATTAALPAGTYGNGTSGTGATITAGSPATLTVDGQDISSGDRVLVKDETAAERNGIYECTTTGDGGTPFVLTRAADMDAADEIPGAFTFVTQGDTHGSAGFVVVGAGPFAIGTDPIPWTQFSDAGTVTAGTGLDQAGNVISLHAPVAIGSGGTGASTGTDALTALAGSQTGNAGKVLRSDGTHTTLAALQASDIPTLNQDTAGTAAGLSATLAIGSGGTGATSAPAALSALGGAAVAGDIGGTSASPQVTATHLSSALPTGQGGTGQPSAAAAISALASASGATAGQVLRADGAGHATLANLQASDIPVLNQNTTGTAANITGTVTAAHGGTGAGTLTGLVKGNGTSAMTAVTAPSGAVVGTTDTQTLTSKTLRGRGALGGTAMALSSTSRIPPTPPRATGPLTTPLRSRPRSMPAVPPAAAWCSCRRATSGVIPP